MSRALTSLSSFALATLIPAVAFACPVCFSANEANRNAFLFTTVLMSLLPLAMIGGMIWFLVARSRELAAEDERGPVDVVADGVVEPLLDAEE